RVFLGALGSGFLVAPLVARAQPTKKLPPRIGYLGNGDPKSARESLDAFRQGLRDLGWIEGQNVQIEYRWAHGESERLPDLAAELVRAKSDLLVVSGSPGIEAARAASDQIPSSLPPFSGTPSQPHSSAAWLTLAATSPGSLRSTRKSSRSKSS